MHYEVVEGIPAKQRVEPLIGRRRISKKNRQRHRVEPAVIVHQDDRGLYRVAIRPSAHPAHRSRVWESPDLFGTEQSQTVLWVQDGDIRPRVYKER